MIFGQKAGKQGRERECAAHIDGDSGRGRWPNLHTMFEFEGNRQHCQVFVLAASAKEECFGVCQFAFKYSATRRSKTGIVSIPCHRAVHNGNVLL